MFKGCFDFCLDIDKDTHDKKNNNNKKYICMYPVFLVSSTAKYGVFLHILMEICIWKLYAHEALFILKSYTLLR